MNHSPSPTHRRIPLSLARRLLGVSLQFYRGIAATNGQQSTPTGRALNRHPGQIVFIEKNLRVGFFGSATAERFSRHEALVGVQVK
jgi:hypothetical protein